MNNTDGKMSSQSDSMKDCHSTQIDKNQKSNDTNSNSCCDDDCFSCMHLTTSPVSESYTTLQRLSELANPQIFSTHSIFSKIIIPPPIV